MAPALLRWGHSTEYRTGLNILRNYDEPYYPVVRYRRVVRPAFAYYGGPRFYGPRYYGGWRRW
ncbi:hypothetical protein [Bradyrhizobium algeriense]|uniref:hypothetical protein n=1 Tax=Bradyrhizobium algeriense TaxID=634784 RepID=UPI000D3A77DC|nr:hypothetical protein [Bradyrhizobium algeriense]